MINIKRERESRRRRERERAVKRRGAATNEATNLFFPLFFLFFVAQIQFSYSILGRLITAD